MFHRRIKLTRDEVLKADLSPLRFSRMDDDVFYFCIEYHLDDCGCFVNICDYRGKVVFYGDNFIDDGIMAVAEMRDNRD